MSRHLGPYVPEPVPTGTLWRKRPVVVEARRMPLEPDLAAVEQLARWVVQVGGQVESTAQNALLLETPSGVAIAHLGDWIIRGVDPGDVYPCPATTFEATYEPADAS